MAMRRKGPAQIIEGKLIDYPLPEVVSQLHNDQVTGILLAHRGEEQKKICFLEGNIVYASSTNKEEKLGYLLVEEGMIRREDVLAAAREGRDLRSYLIEEGKLGAEAFDEAMTGLITDIVASAFDWTTGDFSFVEKDDLDIPGQIDTVSMADVFLEGARCIEDEERIVRGLGDPGALISPGGDADLLEREIHLEPVEEVVFSGIDGTRSLEAVIAESMMGPSMTRRFLYALVLSGHLDVEGRAVQGLPKPTRHSKLAAQRKTARRQVRKSVLKKRKRAGARPAAAAGPKAPPAAQAGAGPAQVEEEPFERQVERLHAESKEKNYYELLGVKQEAGDEEIRIRYYALARNYHPDKLGRQAAPELRAKLEGLFGKFGEAYNTLRDEERRKEYDDRLVSGRAEKESKDVDPAEAAREAFQRGLAVLQRRDMQAAARFFQYAANTHPEKGEYWYHLGICLSDKSTTHRQAEEAFLKALDLEPANYRIYYQLGLLYKTGGLKTRAIQMARRALQWEPDNVKIQQLVAELEGEEEKSGGLGGLFRKK